MQIDASQFIFNLEGKTVRESDKPDAKETTLGMVIGRQLAQQERASDPLRNWALAQKFYAGGTVDVTAEDIVLIKKVVTESPMYAFVTARILQELDK